ncbi:SDR family NAD(P)-dependent oxidoreductase [Microbacterium terregens]|uniref:SDR family NAD(P)-dependent oxidoreductase n=1 Tax=Microbacterium terregens TaxID=69363 RepID=A0ABV5T0J2_9MICO
MTQTWFITGSSRGLGRALAEAALNRGDRVAVTARRPDLLWDLKERFGDRALPLRLDVTDPAEAMGALDQTATRFGGVDVIVNNAGYANVAAIENADDADVRAQFETNFWGVYNVSKAAIPHLRRQRRGLIMQISSIGGRAGGSPGLAPYLAAKFAIDGFSRVLRAETAPFGIRVLIVEPSGLRTDWAGSSMVIHDVVDDYQATVGALNARIRSTQGREGDPARAAEILVALAKRQDIPTQLALGANAAELAIVQDQRLLESDTKWRSVSRSVDFGQTYPVPFPPDAGA